MNNNIFSSKKHEKIAFKNTSYSQEDSKEDHNDAYEEGSED
jgi:hypothetical protein